MYAASSEINGQEDLRSAAMIFNVFYMKTSSKNTITQQENFSGNTGAGFLLCFCA